MKCASGGGVTVFVAVRYNENFVVTVVFEEKYVVDVPAFREKLV